MHLVPQLQILLFVNALLLSSVGLEDVDDLISDLTQALEQL